MSRLRSAAAFLVGAGGGEPPYDAGNTTRRTRTWSTGLTGPNSVLIGGLHTLRNRSRDITRKVPLVAGAYDTIVSNIVGSVVTVRSTAENEAYRTAWNALFDEWYTYCDADGVNDLQGLIALAVRGRFEAGEVFIRHRLRRTEDGYPVPYQIQLLEAEMVPVEMNQTLPNGNRIIAGIEIDKRGQRVAYHMYTQHPGDAALVGATGATVRVPASEVIHYFRQLRPGQMRGIPIAAPALLKIRDWHILDEAVLVKHQVAALMTGFITSPEDGTLNEDDDDPEADLGEAIAKLEPGALVKLLPGEEIEFSQPADSGVTYDPYTKMVLRCIAAVFGLTYEQLTNDLSQVNFSSIRAGLNEAQRKFRMEQSAIAQQIIRVIAQRFTEQSVLAGALSAPLYSLNPGKYCKAKYQPQGWQYVNPQQEINAVKEEIKGGLNSRTAAAAERGRDAEQIDRENEADQKRAKAAGLTYDVTGGAIPAAGRTVKPNHNGGPDDDAGDKPADADKPEDQPATADA